jgi:hypothetical protein
MADPVRVLQHAYPRVIRDEVRELGAMQEA